MTPKEVVKTWFKNIDNQNFDGIRSLMAADHIFYNPMTLAPIGIAEHLGMMQQMTSAFDGMHRIDLLVEEDGWVAVAGRWAGKHTGDFNGVPATGNEVQFTWSDFFQIIEGLGAIGISE